MGLLPQQRRSPCLTDSIPVAGGECEGMAPRAGPDARSVDAPRTCGVPHPTRAGAAGPSGTGGGPPHYAARMVSVEGRRAASLGVIGAGTMGGPMARNASRALQGRGDVVVTGRSRVRVAPLLDEWILWSDSPRGVAERAAVVAAMLPVLPQLE